MKHFTYILLLAGLMLYSCGSSPKEDETSAADHQKNIESFMGSVKTLCGHDLKGEVFANHDHPDMAGHPMVFHFDHCKDGEIRITTDLPTPESVTIILTMVDGELLLKHDVRNPDMTPSLFTMYGGFSEDGNETSQIFPVHNFGGHMWPEYEKYSWEICISEKDGTFEYMELAEDIVKLHYVAQLPE